MRRRHYAGYAWDATRLRPASPYFTELPPKTSYRPQAFSEKRTMSYHSTGSYRGTELTAPLPTGAVSIGEKLKGWLPMVVLVGIGLLAIKLTGKKKRKNPGRKKTAPAKTSRSQAWSITYTTPYGNRKGWIVYSKKRAEELRKMFKGRGVKNIRVTRGTPMEKRAGKKSLKRKKRSR